MAAFLALSNKATSMQRVEVEERVIGDLIFRYLMPLTVRDIRLPAVPGLPP
jgi:hypothetical protein